MARVLIVEDNALIAFALRDNLEKMGHRVVGMAASVEQALDRVTSSDAGADVVLLDADLRGHSSAPVADALREHHIPFIITSGHGKEQLEGIQITERKLSKPVANRELRAAIDQIVSGRLN